MRSLIQLCEDVDLFERRRPIPISLVRFITLNGGVKDQGGNLKAMGFGRFPGLINNRTGKNLDRMREIAAEAGYLGANIDDAMADTDVNDLLAKIEQHPSYSIYDLDDRMIDHAPRAGRRDTQQLTIARREVLDDLVFGGMNANEIDFDLLDDAAHLVVYKGVAVEDAYEQAHTVPHMPAEILPDMAGVAF